MTEVDAYPAKCEVPQSKIRIQVDGALRLTQGLLVPTGQQADEEQRIVGVSVPFVEGHGPRSCRSGIGQVLLDVSAPSPPNPGIEGARKVRVGLSESGIELD